MIGSWGPTINTMSETSNDLGTTGASTKVRRNPQTAISKLYLYHNDWILRPDNQHNVWDKWWLRRNRCINQATMRSTNSNVSIVTLLQIITWTIDKTNFDVVVVVVTPTTQWYNEIENVIAQRRLVGFLFWFNFYTGPTMLMLRQSTIKANRQLLLEKSTTPISMLLLLLLQQHNGITKLKTWLCND